MRRCDAISSHDSPRDATWKSTTPSQSTCPAAASILHANLDSPSQTAPREMMWMAERAPQSLEVDQGGAALRVVNEAEVPTNERTSERMTLPIRTEECREISHCFLPTC